MEEKASIIDLIREFIISNLLIFSLIFVGCILSGIGLFQYLSSNKSQSKVEFVLGQDSKEVKGIQDEVKKITVDIEGAVVNPGVYILEANARIQDAITAAGGITQEADKEFVAKKLNLAQKAIDGGKIYIPVVGDTTSSTVVSASNNTPVEMLGTDTSTDLIDINSADEKALDTLPKIGPVTAKKIIAGRPYSSVEELVSKKVVTQKTLDGFKDSIIAQ